MKKKDKALFWREVWAVLNMNIGPFLLFWRSGDLIWGPINVKFDARRIHFVPTPVYFYSKRRNWRGELIFATAWACTGFKVLWQWMIAVPWADKICGWLTTVYGHNWLFVAIGNLPFNIRNISYNFIWACDQGICYIIGSNIMWPISVSYVSGLIRIQDY
jgi:hypothetical protein